MSDQEKPGQTATDIVDLASHGGRQMFKDIKSLTKSPHTQKFCAEMAWSRAILGIALLSLIPAIILPIVVWVSLFGMTLRPQYSYQVGKTLEEKVDEHFAYNSIDRDDITHFIVSTLLMLHEQNYSGLGFDSLLVGRVEKSLLQTEMERKKASIEKLRKGLGIKIIVPTQVPLIVASDEGDRFTAIVRGYAMVAMLANDQKPRIKEYRARVVLEINPTPDAVNPENYTLISKLEFLGNQGLAKEREWIRAIQGRQNK